MLNWELNAPHRVENLDTFSVSMTVSYTNDPDPARRDRQSRQRPVAASLRLCSRRRRNLRGPSYFAKAVLQKLYRDSGWVKRERQRAPSDRVPARCRRNPARSSICRRRPEGPEPGNDGFGGRGGASGRAGNLARGGIPRRVCPRLEAGRGALERCPSPRRRSRTAAGSMRGTPRSPLRSGRAADCHHLRCGDRQTGRAVAADPPACSAASASSNSPIST